MARYQADDRVFVRSDLELYEEYSMDDDPYTGDSIAEEMLSFSGCEVTISRMVHGKYRITEDGGTYFWTDNMFLGSSSDSDTSDFEPASNSEFQALLFG